MKCFQLLDIKSIGILYCLAIHLVYSFSTHFSCSQITNMYGNRVMEILYIDLGVSATVEVTDLREIPPLLLKDFMIIPPQVTCFCGCMWVVVGVHFFKFVCLFLRAQSAISDPFQKYVEYLICGQKINMLAVAFIESDNVCEIQQWKL